MARPGLAWAGLGEQFAERWVAVQAAHRPQLGLGDAGMGMGMDVGEAHTVYGVTGGIVAWVRY